MAEHDLSIWKAGYLAWKRRAHAEGAEVDNLRARAARLAGVIADLRARLAEVEAERDARRERQVIAAELQRRLDAVEALCNDPTLRVLLGRMWNDRFSAALRGEGDRPAVDHAAQYIAERDEELLRRLGEGPT